MTTAENAAGAYGGIAAMFADACRWKRDAPFLLDPELRLTGTAALKQTWLGARALADREVGEGNTVAFLCGSSVPQAIAFFACQMRGAAVCALHVRDVDARLVRVLETIGATHIVADPDQIDRAAALAAQCATPAEVIPVDGFGRAPDTGGALPERVAVMPDDPAVILCSSGTTGDPKCIVQTHRTVLATTHAGPFIYGVTGSGESTAVPMPPSFAAWIHTVLPFVAMRAKLCFMPRFDIGLYLETIKAQGITVGALVPTAWRMLLADAKPDDLARLKVAFFSGEKGSTSLIADLASVAPSVRTAYLASEGGNAAGVVADEAALLENGKAAVAGRPVPGGDVRILAADGGFDDVLPDGETGEIAVRGASVAAGYLGDADLTAEKFQDGWWRTGDLGLIDADGDLEIRGRADNRINSGGIKIHAEEIENALLQHPAVAEAAVVGVDDQTFGQRIEAHIVMASERPGEDRAGGVPAVGDSDPDPAAILSFCRDNQLLPSAMLPKAIHVHDALPTSPTGKLYRRGLRDTSG